MKNWKFLISVWLLANVLIGGSFIFTNYFWVLFPLTLCILIFITLKNKYFKVTEYSVTLSHTFYGILSGSLLYCVFLVAYLMMKFLNLPLLAQVHELYTIVGPTQWWHYILLLLIIIPGEEIFWRGFIQSKVFQLLSGAKGILVAASLYAIAHIWSGNLMLIAAAATAGIVWGSLYAWKKSLSLVIISHLFFNLWLLVLFPLNF